MSSTARELFCTIATSDHIPQVLALRDSLRDHGHHPTLVVMVVDAEKQVAGLSELGHDLSCVEWVSRDDFKEVPLARDVFSAYGHSTGRLLRWSLKSILLLYLLRAFPNRKVIWIDPDIYFVSDYQFLFTLLERNTIVLSPHWRSIDTTQDPSLFSEVFTHGLYNAGFVGVTVGSEAFLRWWTECCLVRCEKNWTEGTFYDQRYLDVVPLYFDGVEVLRHPGCNLAVWNIERYTVALDPHTEQILINGVPAVFFHFTAHFDGCSVLHFSRSQNAVLRNVVALYEAAIAKYRPRFNLIEHAASPRTDDHGDMTKERRVSANVGNHLR